MGSKELIGKIEEGIVAVETGVKTTKEAKVPYHLSKLRTENFTEYIRLLDLYRPVVQVRNLNK